MTTLQSRNAVTVVRHDEKHIPSLIELSTDFVDATGHRVPGVNPDVARRNYSRQTGWIAYVGNVPAGALLGTFVSDFDWSDAGRRYVTNHFYVRRIFRGPPYNVMRSLLKVAFLELPVDAAFQYEYANPADFGDLVEFERKAKAFDLILSRFGFRKAGQIYVRDAVATTTRPAVPAVLQTTANDHKSDAA